MKELVLTDDQKRHIEKFGVAMERNGTPPAQARIVALLIIADRTELTFDEIRNALQLSKSATSNAINSLLLTDHISYSTKHGDRKRYFSSKIGSMEIDFEKKIAQLLEFKAVFQEVLDKRTKETVEFNKRLARFIDFLGHMQQELPVVYKKWKASRNE